MKLRMYIIIALTSVSLLLLNSTMKQARAYTLLVSVVTFDQSETKQLAEIIHDRRISGGLESNVSEGAPKAQIEPAAG